MSSLNDTQKALQQQLNGAAAFMVLATFFVALKLLALRMQKERVAFGWNDRLAILSLVVFVPLCALVIANGMIVTYVECGMYLIAACLPSLRIVVVRIHGGIKSKISHMVHRYHSKKSSGISSSPADHENCDSSLGQKHVDVKLTGAGNLDTLIQNGQEIGVTKADSGTFRCNSADLA
ncbi:MAG: hypothetical protein Q9162_006057 [Coniocarpon cinnabarinum]